MNRFTIDCSNNGTQFNHYWEMCVGSCRAYTALREDYREQLKKAHDELGFQYLRFHGLLNDDMSVCLEKANFMQPTGEIVYNFFNIDSIFDFLLSIGMKPFVELGFMPTVLASGEQTCFHYKGNVTPPKDYSKWDELIKRLTEHLVERYGIEEVGTWFFEVWNEPNLNYFWAGTQEEYFKLYQHTAETVKSVDSRLRVGGPATSINSWIPDIIQFCKTNHVPLDFISTHHYPSDDPLWCDQDMSLEEFFTSGDLKYRRGCLKEMAEKAKAQAGDLPLYYTEWNTSGNCTDPLHDESYAAAMVAKILADNDGLVSGYSFWTFSDIFEEDGQIPGVFYGGFGLQNVDGIEKPNYRAFELFHRLGAVRIPVKAEKETGEETFTEILATKIEHGLRLIAYNHNVYGEPIFREAVKLVLENIEAVKSVSVYRIDHEHVNPKQKWMDRGNPDYLDKKAVHEIKEAARLCKETVPYSKTQNGIEIDITLPEYSVIAIDVDLKNEEKAYSGTDGKLL